MQYPRSIIMITTIIWCEYIGWRWTECAAYLQRCSAKHFGCDDDDGDGGCCRNWFVGVDNRICGWFDTILRVIVFVIREAVFFSVKFSSTFIKYLYFICIYHELLLRVESKTIENIEFSSYCCIWMSFHDFLYRKIKTIGTFTLFRVYYLLCGLYILWFITNVYHKYWNWLILKQWRFILFSFQLIAFVFFTDFIQQSNFYCVKIHFHSNLKLCGWSRQLREQYCRCYLPSGLQTLNSPPRTDARVHGTPPETRRIPKNYLMISFPMAFSFLPINLPQPSHNRYGIPYGLAETTFKHAAVIRPLRMKGNINDEFNWKLLCGYVIFNVLNNTVEPCICAAIQFGFLSLANGISPRLGSS